MKGAEFIDKYYVERHNTVSLKWDLLEERFGDPDLIAMWVADMDFKTSEAITDALRKRLDHGVFGYAFIPQSYYDAFFNWMENRFGYRPKKEWLRLSTGVVPALYWFVNCYTEPGEAVLISTPVYYPFHNAVKDCNRKLICCDMNYDEGYFTHNFEAFEKAIVENNVKMHILCSPHNPAGRVWTEAELEQVLEICHRHNVVVIADEIHQDFVFGDHKHIPAPLVAGGKYANDIVLVNAASKTFNLAALIHANIIIQSEALRAKYDAYAKMHIRTDWNLMGMIATEAAYTGGADWLEGLMEVIQSNYDYVKAQINQHVPEVIVGPMEGTYLPMLDMRKMIDPEEVKTFVQDRCRAAVDYGEWFGANYKGFIRLNLATHPKFIEQMITNFIAEYKKLKRG